MIKETGKVVNIENDMLWVETTVTSSCNACAAKSNCGTSAVAKAFSDKSVINQVENTLNAQLNDTVEIGIPKESILSASFYMYILPLLLALTSAVVCQMWLSRFIVITEPHVIAATFVGGGIGFWLAKKITEGMDDKKYQPQLLKVLPQTIEVKSV